MKVSIKSVFEEISKEVFSMKSLPEAKRFIIVFITDRKVNETDKQLICKAVEACVTLAQLQRYLCNALLKYEGMGMNQYTKSARKAAQDDSKESW